MRELLELRLAELEGHNRTLTAQLHATAGAMGEVRRMLEHLDEAEKQIIVDVVDNYLDEHAKAAEAA